MSALLRVGVVGVGALGQHHARVYAELPTVRLEGLYDVAGDRLQAQAERYSTQACRSLEELLERVDALSIAVPTVDHHSVAAQALAAGRHVLLEKPITTTLAQADDLIAQAAAAGVVFQVGHIERFNPATEALLKNVAHPRFIEVHRLGSFSPRSLDIDVVLDLMIHDLDVILALDGSGLAQVDAVGVPVLTPKVDIANARLRFASGLIANLTASRVSTEKVRKFRVFAPSTYISVDFAAREAQVYRLIQGAGGAEIDVQRHAAPDDEPLRRQLAAFVASVQQGRPPEVSGEDGRRALALALVILERIEADPQA